MSGNEETSTTPLQVKKSGFQWVVKKGVFSGISRFKLTRNSKTFTFGFNEQSSWYLQLAPPDPSDDDIYVGLYLMPGRKPNGHIRTRFRLGLVTNDGKESDVQCSTKGVFTDSSGWGWNKFIKLDSLLAEENNYFKDDKLTIFCDLEVYRSFDVPESTFCQDLNRMRESQELIDVTLVVGEEELKAHKLVLSAKSDVFAAMFRHDTKENRSGRVEIEDLNVIGVKKLLEFFYCGEIKDLAEIAELVLPAADKYGVERLKILCEQELRDKMDAENVTDFLKLAELHTAKQLKAQALGFISVNSAEVFKVPEFWKLNESNPELLKEIVCAQAERSESVEAAASATRIDLGILS